MQTTIKTLKEMLKSYGLRVSGNKPVLIERLEVYLKLSFFAMKIQRVVKLRLERRTHHICKIQRIARKYLLKTMVHLRGPAYFKRNLCNNEYDFLTGDDMPSIHPNQFYSYVDMDKFIYGFDLISITNLLRQPNTKVPLNPYNRQVITNDNLLNLKRLIKLCRIYKCPIVTEIVKSQPIARSFETRVFDIFQAFDSLGNYTDPRWFTELNTAMLFRFLRELSEIWNYRSQLTTQVKKEICPPYGDPFRQITHMIFADPNMYSLETTRGICLQVMEALTYRGINTDSKTLGVYFVLGAFTIVNRDAAISLPWLYQCFA